VSFFKFIKSLTKAIKLAVLKRTKNMEFIKICLLFSVFSVTTFNLSHAFHGNNPERILGIMKGYAGQLIAMDPTKNIGVYIASFDKNYEFGAYLEIWMSFSIYS